RLKEIPRLIDLEREREERKHHAYRSLQDALCRLGMEIEINNEVSFEQLQSQLPSLKSELQSELEETKERRDEIVLERGQVRQQLTELRDELSGLERRRDNIPEWCVQLRRSLCEELGLAIRELPFAAELMQVNSDERE